MSPLRPAQPSDLERLIEMFVDLANYGIANGERRPLGWDVDPTGDARARFSEAVGNPTEHHVTVAVDEHGDIIGLCHTEWGISTRVRPTSPRSSSMSPSAAKDSAAL